MVRFIDSIHWFDSLIRFVVFARTSWLSKTVLESQLSELVSALSCLSQRESKRQAEQAEKPLVLLCFRSKRLKKHWFYCVFAHKGWKTIGFIVFSLKKIEKPLVLLCFSSKRLKNHWVYCIFVSRCCFLSVFDCVFAHTCAKNLIKCGKM